MSTADELEKLQALKDKGTLSEEEFKKAKESLLARDRPAGEKIMDAVDTFSSDVNRWSMFIHLSQFCAYLVPALGIVVPIVMWQMKKNDPTVDKHGRIVTNWILTVVILGLVSYLLCFVLIGFVLLGLLLVLVVLYPIIGGIKANNGEVWKYPFSLQIFRVEDDEDKPSTQDETPTKFC